MNIITRTRLDVMKLNIVLSTPSKDTDASIELYQLSPKPLVARS